MEAQIVVTRKYSIYYLTDFCAWLQLIECYDSIPFLPVWIEEFTWFVMKMLIVVFKGLVQL